MLCIDFLVCIRFGTIKFSLAGTASQKSCVITLIELTSSYCCNCCSCDAACARPATCGGSDGHCQQQQLRLSFYGSATGTGRDANSATLYKTFISISFHYVEINQVIQPPSQTGRQRDRQAAREAARRTEGQTLSDEESVWAPVGISVALACCSSL